MTASRPRSSLREDQKLLTRNRIIDAAAAAFAENGYADTSIDDIVKVADISRGTFYLHFKNRSEVLAEVFQRGHLDLAIALVERLGEETLTVEALTAWIGRYLDLYTETKDVLAAWYQGDPRERHELAAARDQFSGAFLGVMSAKIIELREKEKRPLKEDDARLRAFLMFVQLERFSYYQVIHNFGFDQEKATPLLARSWHEMVLA
ncbi:MAG TPA: TetR/AcrR family transcriptional regulator [Acidimicrobiales bacterium]|nr:TetR/AcrR family transcriptional regulator [Acidimicrobiales bacterium]